MPGPNAPLIERQNPWWRAPGTRPPSVVPFRRHAFGEILDRTRTGGGGALLLTGLRQVGKTTLALQVLDELLERGEVSSSQACFVKVDDMRLEGSISLADVLEAWSPFRRPGSPALLIIDEVQKLRAKQDPRDHAWAHQLKGAADAQEFQILATGSEALEIGIAATAGAGRWRTMVLDPLSFSEFRRLRLPPGTSPPSAARFRDLELYLTVGGMPRNAREPQPRESLERVREYCRQVLSSTDGVRDRRTMQMLFVGLMQRATEELNVDDLSKDLGASRATIENWLNFFEDSFLLDRLPRLDSSTLRELRGNPKVYPADPSLVTAFAHTLDPLGEPRTVARVFECAVYRHLREVARQTGGSLRFVQEVRGGRKRGEVDFFLQARGHAWLIEVTCSQEGYGKKAAYVRERAVALLADKKTRSRFKDVSLRGLVVHGGTRLEERDVGCVPLADFLEQCTPYAMNEPTEGLIAMGTEITA